MSLLSTGLKTKKKLDANRCDTQKEAQRLWYSSYCWCCGCCCCWNFSSFLALLKVFTLAFLPVRWRWWVRCVQMQKNLFLFLVSAGVRWKVNAPTRQSNFFPHPLPPAATTELCGKCYRFSFFSTPAAGDIKIEMFAL